MSESENFFTPTVEGIFAVSVRMTLSNGDIVEKSCNVKGTQEEAFRKAEQLSREACEPSQKGNMPEANPRGNRYSIYMTFTPSGDPVGGSIRQNTGRSLRAAASKLDTSTEDLVNKGYKVRAGRLYVDR